MPSLRELQRGLSAAIVFGEDDTPVAALGVAAGALSISARIGIYRNNVLGNYRRALAATFPVVKKLVGADFFDAAVAVFVRAYPSTRGDVNGYGGDLPRFLDAYEPARPLAYLPDVARLEWAIDQAGIAADAEPLDLAALAEVPEDARAALGFFLSPSARLIESRYPVLHIWQINQPDHDGAERVDLGEGGDSLLVVRGENGVGIERLRAGETALLRAFAGHVPLGVAAARASEADRSFDLSVALRRHVLNRALAAFDAPDRYAAGREQ